MTRWLRGCPADRSARAAPAARRGGARRRPVRSARGRGLVQAVRREAGLRQGAVQDVDAGQLGLRQAMPSSAAGRRSSAAMRRRSVARSTGRSAGMEAGSVVASGAPAGVRGTRAGGRGRDALMAVHDLFFYRVCQPITLAIPLAGIPDREAGLNGSPPRDSIAAGTRMRDPRQWLTITPVTHRHPTRR